MSQAPDAAFFEKGLAALPLATYQAEEVVLAAGSKTGLLLVLKKGAVSVVKNGVEIAKVAEPGAVFGELSALLDQPHTAEVRAQETSQFHVADAGNLIQDPISLLYIATVLARRLEETNRILVELKSQVQAGQSADVVSKTVERMQEILSASGASLAYAGYPTDPYA